MKAVGATKQFLAAKVGDGCKNNIDDVRRLQRLLIGAGENVGTDDGRWGSQTAAALASFQKKYAKNGVKAQPFVAPGDHCLLIMAWKAGILLPLPGSACIKRSLETFMANKEGKKIIYLFGPSPNVR